MTFRRLQQVALLAPLALLLAAAEESEPLHGFSLEGLEVPRDLVVSAAPRRDPVASLDAPGFAVAEDASWVSAANPVIGVALGGQARCRVP